MYDYLAGGEWCIMQGNVSLIDRQKIRSGSIQSFYLSKCDCASLRKLVLSSWYHSQHESLLLKPPEMLTFLSHSFKTTMQLALHGQMSYLSIQVEKIKAFCIQNGIRELSKPTLRDKTSMPSKDQKLHYIPQEFLLPDNLSRWMISRET